MKTEYRNEIRVSINKSDNSSWPKIENQESRETQDSKIQETDQRVCNAMHTEHHKRCRQVKRKEHRANALASGAEEGRDKLRKAAGRSTYPSIRRYPNGETRIDRLYAACTEHIGVRGEPPELKHLSRVRKRKQE